MRWGQTPSRNVDANRVWGLAPVLLICLFVAGCLPDKTDWDRLEPTVRAPDFALPQLDGEEPIRLSDLRGNVVIMEFWATWCQPCRFSTPSLDVIYRRYRDRGVTVLLINNAEDPDKVRKWIDGRFAAPVLLDSRLRVARNYQVRGIPSLFLIDQHGQILYIRSGYTGGLEHNLKLILEELLAEEPAEAHG